MRVACAKQSSSLVHPHRTLRSPSVGCHAPHPAPCVGKPELPPDFEQRTWEKLRDAVHAVHDKQPVSSSLEELYAVSGWGTGCAIIVCWLAANLDCVTIPQAWHALATCRYMYPTQAVQDMCMHRLAEKLYQRLEQVQFWPSFLHSPCWQFLFTR